MRSLLSHGRILTVVGALGIAVLSAGLVASMSGSLLSILLAAALGLLLGGLLGQTAAWARAAAGSARRGEFRLNQVADLVTLETRRVREAVRSGNDSLTQAVSKAEVSRRDADERLAKVVAKTREDIGKSTRATRRNLDEQVALLEAYLQLLRLVPMDRPMPRAGTWAASEDLLLWLVGQVLARQPRLIVDLGSGQSSVWMAAALRESGVAGRVIALDHDAGYAEQTRRLAAEQGLSRWLEVREAPLVEVEIDGRTMEFYDPSVMADLHEIDLLCIDGPPGSGREQARWPALPLLRESLARGAFVVLDDLIRTDEQEIVTDWLQRFPELILEELPFEKGAAVFRVP